MAMIKCRECGHEISDQAAVCPHCGARTQSGVEGSKVLTSAIAGLVVVVLGLALMLYGIMTMTKDLNSYWNHYTYTPPFTSHETSTMLTLAAGFGCVIGGSIGSAAVLKKSKNAGNQQTAARPAPSAPAANTVQANSASAETWICPQCGSRNSISAKFCGKCGTRNGK